MAGCSNCGQPERLHMKRIDGPRGIICHLGRNANHYEEEMFRLDTLRAERESAQSAVLQLCMARLVDVAGRTSKTSQGTEIQ